MKIANSKKYLVPAVVGLLLVMALPFYFFFQSVSKTDDTHYIYIDADKPCYAMQVIVKTSRLDATLLNLGRELLPSFVTLGTGSKKVCILPSPKHVRWTAWNLSLANGS